MLRSLEVKNLEIHKNKVDTTFDELNEVNLALNFENSDLMNWKSFLAIDRR